MARRTNKHDRKAVDFVVCFHLFGIRSAPWTPSERALAATHEEEGVVINVTEVLCTASSASEDRDSSS